MELHDRAPCAMDAGFDSRCCFLITCLSLLTQGVGGESDDDRWKARHAGAVAADSSQELGAWHSVSVALAFCVLITPDFLTLLIKCITRLCVLALQ